MVHVFASINESTQQLKTYIIWFQLLTITYNIAENNEINCHVHASQEFTKQFNAKTSQNNHPMICLCFICAQNNEHK